MESSSENSFAWTDTSSDSFDSNTMAPDEKVCDNIILSNHISKKRKQKKSVTGTSPNINKDDKESKMDIKEEQSYDEIKNDSFKKKMIKLEPDSDIDRRKTKKKIKEIEINGSQTDSQGSTSYDETYLDMKVKQESCNTASIKQKQKKKKRQLSINTNDSLTIALLKNGENSDNYHSSAINDGNVGLKQEIEYVVGPNKAKKKKKKAKKRYNSGENNSEIEMDIEESDLNKKQESTIEMSIVENTQEESGYGEISAIEYDDGNFHSISFINKSLEKENTKKTYSDSLSKNAVNKLAENILSEQESNKSTKVLKQRTSRISDRIRFEDEEDTYIETSEVHERDSEKDKNSVKLKQFIKINPKLKQLSKTFSNSLTLTQDDEIWVLKCPREIDIKAFNNASLNIHGKCKIKVGGQTYDGSAENEESGTVALLTMEHYKYQIKNLPVSGFIHLRKRIPKAHIREDNIMVNNQINFIPLPETKCRHPLFGSNYKKALKIPSAIAERLNVQDSEESFPKAEKKKRKKNKKDKNTSEQFDTQVNNDVTIKSESYAIEENGKKRKKRKAVDDDVPNKVKRIKHDPESAEAWESEKAIEENLFNF